MAILDGPAISSQHIGREREIAHLERALHAAMSKHGQAYLISGDAGVGKSRLVSELIARAEALEMCTIRAQAFEQDISYPFSLWIDALHTYFATTPTNAIVASFGPYVAELSRLLPEVTSSLPNGTLSSQNDPETEKRRIFDGLAYFFTNLATIRPLLLVVEDLHWSDKSTLDFLHFFIRRLASLPILLLVTYRHNETSPALQHLLAQLDRERLSNEISLKTLSQSEVEKLLISLLESARPPHPQLTEAVYSYTEGNPFYIEEILKLWLASGEIMSDQGRPYRVSQSELQIPRSVLDTIQQRSAQLSPAAQNMLAVSAVIGRRFDFALTSDLLSLKESEQVALMKELIASQLVVEESAEHLTFRHALTREAVYASLLRRERKQLHRQIAEAMARLYAHSIDRQLSALAYHAYEGELWQETLDYSIRAGQQAQALYAPREAIEHYTKAIEASQHLDQTPSIALVRARGKAFEMVGEAENARTDYEETLKSAKSVGDGLSEWQALIDLGFYWAAHDYTFTGLYFQQALELARLLEQPLLVAHSLNRVGNWYANVEQPAIALGYHEEALAGFRALDDQRALAESYDLLGMAYQLNSDLLNSYQAFQRALELWTRLQERSGLASTLASLPFCAPQYFKNLDIPAVTFQKANDAASEARRIAHSIGWRSGEAFALFIMSMSLGAYGEYELALESAERGLSFAEEIEHLQWTVGSHVALGTIYLDLLAFDSALLHLRRAMKLADLIGSKVWIGSDTAYLAHALTATGQPDEALAILKGTLPPETAMQIQWHRMLWFAQAEALLATGDAVHAEEIVEALIAATQGQSVQGQSGQPHSTKSVIPRLWLLLGKCRAARGNVESAISILKEAIQAAIEQEAKPLLWRIHVAVAEILNSSGEYTVAENHLSIARKTVLELAANLARKHLSQEFVAQATKQFPTIQASPTPSLTPRQAAKQEFGGLTSREREVALLLAQGKTNQEIATELTVGIRTVEAHITRILNKLDFTSRVQVATWVIERIISQDLPTNKP